MWAFLPAQLRPNFHTTAHPAAPFSSHDQSSQSTSPGWETAPIASCSAIPRRRWRRCAEFRWPVLRQKYLFHPSAVLAEVDHPLPHGLVGTWPGLPWVTTLASARGVGFCCSVGPRLGASPTLPSRLPDWWSGNSPLSPSLLAHPTKIRTAARACASVPCGSLLDELVAGSPAFGDRRPCSSPPSLSDRPATARPRIAPAHVRTPRAPSYKRPGTFLVAPSGVECSASPCGNSSSLWSGAL